MRVLRTTVVALALLLAARATTAQSTNGTIMGRVVDAQGGVLPGVTIEARSAAVPGIRTTVTLEGGDYVMPLLPPGVYNLVFTISGFEQQERAVSVAPTQVVPLDVTLGVAAVRESVPVTARPADVLTQTAQSAITLRQELMSQLPGARDVTTAMLLAPAVHATGPGGVFSISGAMTFESLYMVNGVTATENIRGQIQQNLVIEDAIQETTVASSGVSAEFGRFSGGVVNVVTKRGGDLFSGSFRDTLNNDNWRARVPKRDGDLFNADTKLDDVVPTYEFTLGGPILQKKLWFFAAGRAQSQRSARQLVLTNIPYTFKNDIQRYEGKLTYALARNHQVQGTFTQTVNKQFNFATGTVLDTNSLLDRELPERLTAFEYTGVLSPAMFLEARYSARDFTLSKSGGRSTDRVLGTMLQSQAGRRYWAPTFCGICGNEQRDNQEVFAKLSYLLSTKRFGAHHLVAGGDSFNDRRFANNHQTGSDYIIVNAEPIVRGTTVYPQFTANTRIRWRPILVPSSGTNFRTQSLFLNDTWAVSPRLSATLGLRWDKNNGRNGADQLVAKDGAFSPRLGLVFAPNGDAGFSYSAGFSRYVAAVLNSVADFSSAGGNPDLYDFAYAGPAVNADPNGVLVPTETALADLFAWFEDNGGRSRPLVGLAAVRGVTAQTGAGFRSPNVLEYSGGVSRAFGSRGSFRADFTFRDFRDFYVQRTDLTTGSVVDTRAVAPSQVAGRRYDLTIIENSNVYNRQYAGLSTQGTWRVGQAADLGASYTLSRTWGNVDGETLSAGPLANDLLAYPEYKQAEWNAPSGNLSIDQRHRARLWATYQVSGVDGLSVSGVQTLESGVPYGASNVIDTTAFVANPGYLTPPTGAVTYYFTDRDAFRTQGQKRFDLAVNYTRALPGLRRAKLFGQLQVVNLFNQLQLCGCGGSVFVNGAGVDLTQTIDQTVRTSQTNAALLQAFNPFTTTPVEGTNWALGPNFGHALTRFAYTTPRQLRLSFGVRF